MHFSRSVAVVLFFSLPVLGAAQGPLHVGAVVGYQYTRLSVSPASGPSVAEHFHAMLAGIEVDVALTRHVRLGIDTKAAVADGLTYAQVGTHLTLLPRALGPYGRIGFERITSDLSGACVSTLACSGGAAARWGLNLEAGHPFQLSKGSTFGPVVWFLQSTGSGRHTRNLGIGIRFAGR